MKYAIYLPLALGSIAACIWGAGIQPDPFPVITKIFRVAGIINGIVLLVFLYLEYKEDLKTFKKINNHG
jgi:hypothetical protein